LGEPDYLALLAAILWGVDDDKRRVPVSHPLERPGVSPLYLVEIWVAGWGLGGEMRGEEGPRNSITERVPADSTKSGRVGLGSWTQQKRHNLAWDLGTWFLRVADAER
jgi:hypothetical protein